MGSGSDTGLHLFHSSKMNPNPAIVSTKLTSDFNAFKKEINIQLDVEGKKMKLTVWPVGFRKPSRPQLTASAPELLPPGQKLKVRGREQN